MKRFSAARLAAAAAAEPPPAAVPGPSSRVAFRRSLGAGETIKPSEVKTMFDVCGMKHAIETGTVCSVCHHPVKVVVKVELVMCSKFAISCSNCSWTTCYASPMVRGINSVISKFTQQNLAAVNKTITNGSCYAG